MDEKTAERIATLEANDRTLFHQLDEVKHEVKEIHRLTAAVEAVATQTKSTAEKVDAINERLEGVEKSPTEDFKYYKRTIIGAVFTGVVGIIIGAVLTLIIK